MKDFKLLLSALLAFATTGSPAGTAHAETWLKQIGGRGADVVYAVAETSDGRLCASGTAWTGSQLGEGDEAIVLESAAAQQVFVACYHENGSVAFARPLAAGRGNVPRAMAALPGGDLLVTGLRETSDGNADAFVVRIDQHGEEVWSQAYGGALADSGNALSVGGNGEIYLAAGFEDRLTWRDGERLAKLHSAGSRDAIVLRLNADGSVAWARRFGGEGFDEASVVQARRDGGALVGGTFRGSVDLGDLHFESRGFRDVIVAAFDADGDLEWARQFGGPGQDTVRGIVEDDRQQITVVGDFHDRMRLTPEQELHSDGSSDVYVARLDGDGQVLHGASFGGPLTDQVFALAIDRDNRLILAGHYQGVSDLAPGPRVATIDAPSPANSSGYILVLNENGDYLMAEPVTGLGMEMVLGIQALRDGRLGVAGLFNKDLSIGDSDVALDARGKTDVFVARIARPGPDVVRRPRNLRQGGLSDDPLSW